MSKQSRFYVNYYGEALTAHKSSVYTGSHFLSEETALQRVLDITAGIGVSRASDVTGFDRIGIPVTNSIKPAVLGSCVQHGKGLTTASAKISALMESLERHFALNAGINSFWSTYNEVKKQFAVISVDKMLHARSSLFHEDLPMYWTTGWDLIHHCEVAAPLAMVELAGPKSIAGNTSSGHIQLSSNGLASGFNILEAISQALFEVFERDALTCHVFASYKEGVYFPLKRVDLDTIPYPEINGLTEKFRAADVFPALYDCAIDTQVPTFNCYLMDELDPSFMLAHGSGSDLDPVTAMARAMTESAQSRAVFLAGIRDITFEEEFEGFTAKRSANYKKELYNTKACNTDYSSTDPVALDDYAEIISLCLEKLQAAGLDQALVFKLTPDDYEVNVVRALVPGMEGQLMPSSRPGQRAKRHFKEGLQ